MTAPAADTRPFSPFEWMLALRYLRARRKEGFISVIAGFSFLGILLGVATLIIVMAVMNGFRKELFNKILGSTAMWSSTRSARRLRRLRRCRASACSQVPGVKHAVPLIEGQVMASTPAQALGGKVRGLSEEGIKALPLIAKNIRAGTLDGFDSQEGIAIGTRLANSLRVNVGDTVTLVSPRGATTPFGTAPRIKSYKIAGRLRDGHGRVRPQHDLHAAGRSAALLQQGRFRRRARGDRRGPRERWPAGRQHEGRPAIRRCTSPTGGSATRASSPCSRSSAT